MKKRFSHEKVCQKNNDTIVIFFPYIFRKNDRKTTGRMTGRMPGKMIGLKMTVEK